MLEVLDRLRNDAKYSYPNGGLPHITINMKARVVATSFADKVSHEPLQITVHRNI